ncbi:exodeoxyribonuclease V subunit alpha [Niastella yeongjuensis]|uniref:RecBCD enzyme subunit RecD n=1 Tax=Niastella yeongjuensis TaxID=354355 RepID=A0A1V9ET27_9BACT|nr:exodeoxyribonuclease V subunit alpha [Niastella yeongjuensis]OQP49289.1 exodeoxyribonuclease V subunit alpha [Niastella yeongjuensis]SEP43018.1 DNA helicase/exodeoxyribonuclease V, alpha subunit [Niastella yeongjuensis]
MQSVNDIHYQFASFFKSETLKPYAYLVSKKLDEGHICLHLKDVPKEIKQLPFFDIEKEPDPRTELTAEKLVTKRDGGKQPFVLHNDRLYLQRYFNYESIILDRIHAFIASEAEEYLNRTNQLNKHKDLIQKLFAPQNNLAASSDQNMDWQFAAALSGVLNNFTIITGGPGTGKTTTVAKILALLYAINPQLKVALAAPTGKAAARMAESLKNAKLPIDKNVSALFQSLEPSTIHRLLKAIPESPHFRQNKDNPLNYDVVIIDESSMIDVALFAKLLDAIGHGTRLIMLGDKDQLASVEAGSLFGDLCQAQKALNQFSAQRAEIINSFNPDKNRQIQAGKIAISDHPLFEHIVELQHSHRFSGSEGIGRFSKAVIGDKRAVIKEFLAPDADEQVIIDETYSKEVFEGFISGYEEFIHETDVIAALHKLNNLRVLCAVREGEQGVYSINQRIESYLHRKRLIAKTGEWYVNRPIIVTRNYYDLELFNGDIGILRYDAKGVLRAWFEDKEGKPKHVLPGYIAQTETVFAMTIHKSQGSEFNQVLVMLPNAPDIPILTSELLYTAVTRAKKKAVIQGTEDVILKAAGTRVQRGSGIIERFLHN